MMKVFKLNLIALVIGLVAPVTFAQAEDNKSNDELRADLLRIQQRLDELEKNKTTEKKSDTKFKFYGSIRPIIGYNHSESLNEWGVEDANSRLGFTVSNKISDTLTVFGRGEFKIKLDSGGDFGDVRHAYAGVEGMFGRIAIGQQSVTHDLIAEPINIFNRAEGPLAYACNSPLRLGNLVTYRKSFGNLLLSTDVQFDEDIEDQVTHNKGLTDDFFNAGTQYKSDLFTIAVAYYNRDLYALNSAKSKEYSTTENTYGVSVFKQFDKLYLATAYQYIDVSNQDDNRYTLDVVATYPILKNHKLMLGYGKFDDSLNSSETLSYDIFNATLEWQKSKTFKTFIEYQRKDYYELSSMEDDNQIRVGIRYDFSHSF